MVNCSLKGSVMLYVTLHGFREGRGMGTEALVTNLEEQLSGLAHEPLFQDFLDVHKAYDSLDMEQCLELLRIYRLGKNLCRILKNYWKRQRIVTKAGNYLGTLFGTGRLVTQGDPILPMIFKIVVDVMERAVLDVVCIPQEAQRGMGWAAGEINLVLYADGGRKAGRNHEWVQDALTVTVDMFRRMGLEANLEKIKAMVCTPGFI